MPKGDLAASDRTGIYLCWSNASNYFKYELQHRSRPTEFKTFLKQLFSITTVTSAT